MKKRALCLALVLVMLATLLPVGASAASLTVSITKQPSDAAVNVGGTAVFTVDAQHSGGQELTYVWVNAGKLNLVGMSSSPACVSKLNEAKLGEGKTLILSDVTADMDGMTVACVVYTTNKSILNFRMAISSRVQLHVNTAAEGSSWMSALPDGIRLSDIVLPGTHDSSTQYVQLALFSQCQTLGIGQQLNAGFRFLDLRLAVDGDRMKMVHGITECRTGLAVWSAKLYLEGVLEQCYAFLDANPTETVVLSVKQDDGDESTEEFETLFMSYVDKNPEYWLTTDSIPTLGEARGKLVIMRRFGDNAGFGAKAGIPMLWSDQGGSDDVSLNTAANANGSYTLWVQDRYEYNTEDKWNAFTAGMLEPGEGTAVISFLSTKGSLPVGQPSYFAGELNPRLLACESLSGWVIIDFGTPELARHIYEMNFR
ncbi:MAG: phosphatidylinositol-specific phospholipase C [Oscillospiraceae bacterium]|nr:phosphatidylinositol-specific phospholipase C [Oscillospiraceae bacterium]